MLLSDNATVPGRNCAMWVLVSVLICRSARWLSPSGSHQTVAVAPDERS
ncbi:hypothetical protein KCP69_25660 [Salmonella enterica subsp. enterica]|nr:hypothetical protein KCP69_25660 [Salmonella enterica subsp. enterica]